MSESPSLWKHLFLSAFVAFGSVFFVGCQRQAYTDFYTESMASEVRELENRIYEYDAAYQSIEQELAVLEAENAELHSRLMHIESAPKNKPLGGSSFNGSSSLKTIPAEAAPVYEYASPIETGPIEIPSVDNLPPPRASKPAEPTPAPKREAAPKVSPAAPPKASTDANELVPPKIEFGSPSRGSGLGSSPTETLPKLNAPSSGGTLPPSTPPSGSMPTQPGNTTPSMIMPPPKQGTSLPPKPNRDQSSPLVGGLPSSPDEAKASTAKIEVPVEVVAAGFQEKRKNSSSKRNEDRKIVEIAFHPSLCRGQNLDEEEGDDGLYLVLQPRNQAGEIVDEAAAVTVVAMDPKRPEGEERIGRWTISKEELESALEPIGLSRGYHLSLPWQNEVAPDGDVVQVYVRYEMADGRRLINERRIQLHRAAAGSNVWMPRVK